MNRRRLRTELRTRRRALFGFSIDVGFPLGDQYAQLSHQCGLRLGEVVTLAGIFAQIEHEILAAILDVLPWSAPRRTLR